MMPSAETLIDAGYPLWIVFFVIVLPLFVTLSKNLGSLNTILGSANRWWQGRQDRAVTKVMTIDEKIDAAVRQRVEIKIAPIMESVTKLRAELKESNDEVDRVKAKLESALKEIAYRDEYSLEQSRYIRHINEWAAQEGYEIPTPPHRPARFTEWLAIYLEKEKKQYED